MIETTVNVPFAVKLETDSNGYAYVDHDGISASTYGSAAKAKSVLRERITEQIEEGLKTLKHYQTRALGTVDGAVFIIRYHVGSWQYSIVGPDYKFGGSCHGPQSFDETLANAKKHAIDSFGGITWECSL